MENGIKILYVDDEIINTEVFDATFSENFQILTAYSGMEGLDLIHGNPDIRFIITDMKMPRMNGLEFIQEVKKLNKDLPCMLLSGYQLTPEINRAIKDGIIVSYMVKPFDKTGIEKLIVKYT